jgi:hypothetical protein
VTEATGPTPAGGVSHRLLEVITVVLLALATLGSAWCAYQVTRWNGVEASEARHATDDRIDASRQFSLGTQKVAYDASVVAQLAQAIATGNQQLQDFIRKNLVRPDFAPVVDQWRQELASGGTINANLFENQDYLQTEFAAANAADAKAAAATAASQDASVRGDAYTVTTLLMAAALFLAGVTSSFKTSLVRILLLAASALTLAYAAARISTFPVA